jgi:glycine/D-amino acid oxidase-like deaminating enzyme/nitrite reductase/ring-hydroxylating ferredoxin subunit
MTTAPMTDIHERQPSSPTWQRDPDELRRAPLAERMVADVCVIGAGIFGISTAYLLQRDGRRVVVLDDGGIAGGQSGRTSAHLTAELDRRYVELERVHGLDGARRAADSHQAAIARIEQNVVEEGIDCDFARIDGFLFAADGDRSALSSELRDEMLAAQRAGLEVESVARAPLSTFDTGPCLRFPHQARFEPVRYLAGLSRAFERAGGRIFTGSRVADVVSGAPARVTTKDGQSVVCDAVVVATNSPINDRFVLHTKQAPYMTYVIAARVPRGSVPDILLWDTDEPYHYVRVQPGAGGGPASAFDHVVIGGEDHKTGQAQDGAERFLRLELWAQRHFPGIQAIDHRWAGQVLEPSDGLAYIGRNPGDGRNVFVGTGASGNGLTYGTLAGMLLTDLIAGRPNPWQTLYDPARVRIGGAREMLRENLNVATQYTTWLRPGQVSSESEIAPGSGAVLRVGLDRIAVYRDDDGTLYRRKAACPHLGCVVAWNGSERTWDCPCHGSRFDRTGRVIVGPANRDLASVAGEPKRADAGSAQSGTAHSMEDPRRS